MSRARRRVPIGDLPQLMKDLGKIATHPALIDGAEAAGAHVSNTAKREARFTDQTGNLRQSIFWSKPEVKRGTIRLTVGANMSYAVFIEFGAAEGARLGGKRGSEGLKVSPRPASKEGPEDPEGGRPFLRPALIQERDKVMKLITVGIRRALKEVT